MAEGEIVLVNLVFTSTWCGNYASGWGVDIVNVLMFLTGFFPHK